MFSQQNSIPIDSSKLDALELAVNKLSDDIKDIQDKLDYLNKRLDLQVSLYIGAMARIEKVESGMLIVKKAHQALEPLIDGMSKE